MSKGEMEFDNLTSLSQTPYSSNEGDNFMTGESEQNQVPNGDAPQETSETRTDQTPPKKNDRSSSSENEQQTNQAREAAAEREREGEDGRQKEARKSMDRTGITDKALLEALNAVDVELRINRSANEMDETAGALGEISGQVSQMQREGTPAEKENFEKEKKITLERIKKRTDEVIAELRKKMDEAGKINKIGITNEHLLGELNAVDDALRTSQTGEEMVAALRGALEQVNRMREDTPAERENFSREQQLVRERIMKKTEETIIENRKSMDANYRPQGLYGERKLTKNEKMQIENAKIPGDIEKLFNRMFDRVDGRLRAEFSAAFGSIGQFEHDEFTKTLNEAITNNKEKGTIERAEELDKILNQFENEFAARSMIHNAYYAVLTRQGTADVAKFLDAFDSGYADLGFSKRGVTQAMHFYEQALLITRESAGGYIKSTEIGGDLKGNKKGKVNDLARQLLEDANAKGLLVVYKETNKEKGEVEGEPILKDGKVQQVEAWEIDRALAFARGLSIADGRTIEIAGSSRLAASQLADQFGQRIIAELFPFRHEYKFYQGKPFLGVLAYLKHRKNIPWTYKEIEDFKKLKEEDFLKVLNGLVPEGKERFIGVLNPFEIGGMLTRTGWRVRGVEEGSMIANMLTKFKETGGKSADDMWIGTGIQLERNRSDLVKNKKEAVDKVRKQLENVGNRTPLRIFLNIKSTQEKIIDQYLSEEGIDIKQLKTPISGKGKEKEEADRAEKLSNLIKERFKKLQPSLEELALLQERSNLAKQNLNLEGASEATKDLVKRIKEVWDGGERDNFFKTLKDNGWRSPFTFGTDDIPYDQYTFAEAGQWQMARRWGDMGLVSEASKAMKEFISKGIEGFTSQEQIVQAMRKIYDPLQENHPLDAQKLMMELGEGVMKFYGKDYMNRLPLGIGTLTGALSGRQSYAQVAYGRGKMAWDELQLNEFTRKVMDAGLIDKEAGQQQELQRKAGGGKTGVVWGYARTIVPLLELALAYYIFTQVTEEKK